MDIGFNLAETLENTVAVVAKQLEGFDNTFVPDVRSADPRFGDFQVNGVLPFAKRTKQNPRALAQSLLEALEDGAGEAFAMEVAGPGFINFSLRPATLLDWLQRHRGESDLRSGASELFRGKRVVVDYSSPNTAKQMHVAHIRSMVVGEAISRLFAFAGASVIRDNHIGDWGTQYGKLIHAYKNHLDTDALARDPLEELERLYKKGDALSREDPAVLDQARAELVKLQRGEPENLKLWEEINRLSEKAFEEIYEKLDVRFDAHLGESFYRDKVDEVYRELAEHGIAQESDGALVVFHPEHPRFSKQPFIIRKSDGASNYASTDLATVLYRVREWQAEKIVYVTDARQRDHFEQLFLTVRKWFAATERPVPELDHVCFGTILGEDGKAIKTRSGDPIKLKDLLAEAERRARAIVEEKNSGLPEEEKADIAQAIGLGAVRYADLAQNRTSDYVFAWDKILSFEGNTAPYLLYAVARIHSIFTRMGDNAETEENAATPFETERELKLARKLAGFPEVLKMALGDLRPHFIGTYLYELAGEFSGFYSADKVLVDDPGARARRILLCRRTLLAMEGGLNLLGIRTLRRM